MTDLGWKSVGVLELTALPTMDPDRWVPWVRGAVLLTILAVSLLSASGGPLAARPAASQLRSNAPAAPVGSDTVRIGVLRNGSYDIVTLPMEVYVARVLAGEAVYTP